MQDIKIVCEELDYNIIVFEAYDEEYKLLGYMNVRLLPFENFIEKLVVDKGADFDAVAGKLLNALMLGDNLENQIMAVPARLVFSKDEFETDIAEQLNKRADCIVSSVGTRYSAACSEFINSPLIQQYLAKNQNKKIAVSIRNLNELQQKELCMLLSDKMINPVDSAADLRAQYENTNSLVLLDKERVKGCMLMSENDAHNMTIDAVCLEKSSMEAIAMFIQAATEALERDPEMIFTTLAVNDISRQLLNKLLEHTNNILVSPIYEAHFLPGLMSIQ